MNIYDAIGTDKSVSVAYNERLNLCVARYLLPKRSVFYLVSPLSGRGRMERCRNIDEVMAIVGYGSGDDWQTA